MVVVDAPLTPGDDPWVRDVCDALGATAVWAVVDATRKTADTARYLHGMGTVDAIAVHRADATADPASVLELGVPVVSIDGKPATVRAWAALLAERMQPALASKTSTQARRTRQERR